MAENTCTGSCTCQRGEDDRGSVSRRGVLAGSAAAAATVVLAACSTSDSTSGAASSPAADPSPSQADSSSAAAEPSASPSDGSTGEVLAGTDDFPVGGGAVVQTGQGPVVVTHPTDTEYLAFTAICPHSGCTVGEVLENTIVCNCHGSTFDGSNGDRLGGPAPTGLDPVDIQVSDGEISLA